MIKNKELTKRFIIGAIIIVAALVILMMYLKNDAKDYAKDYAEEFLEIMTNPQELESTKYYRDLFDSEGMGDYGFEEYGAAMKKDYGVLMTDRGFEDAVANRNIPWKVLVQDQEDYDVIIDSIDLKKMKDYADGRVYYSYLISMRIELPSGDNEAMTVSGDIVMMKEGSGWLVDVFRWNADYQELYKLVNPIQ